MKIKEIFADSYYLVVDKPAGILSVQAGKKKEPSLEDLLGLRAVHRLDRDTSGILVLAKSDAALEALQAEFKARRVVKEYLALAWGYVPSRGRIESPLLRRHNRRNQFRVSGGEKARFALTEFHRRKEISFKNNKFSLLEVKIHTGRTHQIRVHLSSIKHPVVGDKDYGLGKKEKEVFSKPIKRHFLHAFKLEFHHPLSGEKISLVSELPSDLQSLLDRMEDISRKPM